MDVPALFLKTRAALGLSQEAMAHRLGIALITYDRYEKGKREPKASLVEAVKAIADGHIQMDESHTPSLVHIPLVAPRLSAGAGEVVESEEVVKYLAFQREWMSRVGSPRQMVLMRVTGDSMRPTVLPGDIAMIDRARSELEEDKIHAISWFGELAVKRLRRNETGKVEVISDNPSYPVRLADGEGFRIIGRVVWLGREL